MYLILINSKGKYVMYKFLATTFILVVVFSNSAFAQDINDMYVVDYVVNDLPDPDDPDDCDDNEESPDWCGNASFEKYQDKLYLPLIVVTGANDTGVVSLINNLRAIDVSHFQATLIWGNVVNENGFRLIYGSDVIDTLPENTTQATIGGLHPNATYTICVEAFNSVSTSEACVTFVTPVAGSTTVDYFVFFDFNGNGVYDNFLVENPAIYCSLFDCTLRLEIEQMGDVRVLEYTLPDGYIVTFPITRFYTAQIDGTLNSELLSDTFFSNLSITTTSHQIRVDAGYTN